MKYEITLEQSLILNFFNSSIYFVFENDEEKDSFLNFIKIYDDRFKDGFDKKPEMKSAMWKYTGSSHRHQMEWMNDADYFIKNDAVPVSYSFVIDYCNKFSKMYGLMKEMIANFK